MDSGKRPNIVVLMADDHRGTELSHLERAQAQTPELDALAARGVSFGQAHCQGAMMGAVCTPSRASLMTGRNIFASSCDPTGADGQKTMTIPADLATFPQALRDAGYHTHHVGKWHNDTDAFQRSFSSAGPIMFGGMSDHHHVPIWRFDPEGRYPYVETDPEEQTAHGGGGYTMVDGFSTNLFADAAIDFLSQPHHDPFLLFVAFTAPHDPRTPPPGWEVDPATVELPPNAWPQHPFDNGELAVRDELLAAIPRDPEEVRQHIADYYGMIAHLDLAIGRITSTLDAFGLAEDTVVIYTADHGLAVGQHGLMGKQNLYEHSTRIPLVMAGPGIPVGQRSDALVWHADTTATVRHVAGVAPDPAAEGESLVADGAITANRREFGSAYSYGQRAYRDERYKLIRTMTIPADSPRPGSTPGSDMVQLFDLEADPWEMNNLAERAEHQAIRRRLESGLVAWHHAVNDELLSQSSGL